MIVVPVLGLLPTSHQHKLQAPILKVNHSSLIPSLSPLSRLIHTACQTTPPLIIVLGVLTSHSLPLSHQGQDSSNYFLNQRRFFYHFSYSNTLISPATLASLQPQSSLNCMWPPLSLQGQVCRTLLCTEVRTYTSFTLGKPQILIKIPSKPT